MAFVFLDALTINISRILEALFDELEYRAARRDFRQVTKLKARRPSRRASDEMIATPSKVVSIRAA
jgi:hypothetical protein